MLKLNYLNRLLHIAYEEINRTRLKRKFNIYLKEDTFNKFQFNNIKYFFNNKLRIKYLYINASLFTRLIILK